MQKNQWGVCPRCHQMSAVPRDAGEHTMECLDCGYVWNDDQNRPLESRRAADGIRGLKSPKLYR